MGCAQSAPAPDEVDTETHELESRGGRLHYAPKRRKSEDELPPTLFFGLFVEFDDLELDELVGEGAFGEVYAGRYQGRRIAIKRLFLPSDRHARQGVLKDFTKELSIISRLHHPNILQFLGAVQRSPNYCILSRMCAGCVKDILAMVRRHRITVTWKLPHKIATEAAMALAYLHGLRPQILHRDLKAENLLLGDDFTCYVADFGLSRAVDTPERLAALTRCGTPSFIAPEILRGDPYNAKVDVYSFAIVLYELFCFRKPYKNTRMVMQVADGLRPDIHRGVPGPYEQLMRDCWEDDPAARPTFMQVCERLNHAFTTVPVNDHVALPSRT